MDAPILQIPDELLVPIIEFAARNSRIGWLDDFVCEECDLVAFSGDPRLWDYERLRTLSLVCRRFTRIAQPLLFRAILYKHGAETATPSGQLRKLHRTLQENPQLREYCRSLDVRLPDCENLVDPQLFSVVDDLASWLTGLRCLSLSGRFEKDSEDKTLHQPIWDLIRRFATNCENIDHVDMSAEVWSLYQDTIFSELKFINLKTLSIYGISRLEHRKKVELGPEKHRTAPFTSLILSCYQEETPDALSLLIQWPTTLTFFQFNGIYRNRHKLDLTMFESWLLIHKNTLKHIDIGGLSRDTSVRYINATLFPNLEFLKLSRYQKPYKFEFTAEDANLLGPSLKTFVWDLNMAYRRLNNWRDFTVMEKNWVRDLVNVAVARKAALKTIKIQFLPYDAAYRTSTYSWDLMDDLRDNLLKPNGMDLEYNEPNISREDWLENHQPYGDED